MQEIIDHAITEGARIRASLLHSCTPQIAAAAVAIRECLRAGHKLLFFGNGGSAADAQHLATEFVARLACERAPLPAIALTTDSSLLTAIGNDYGFEQIFARQVQALGTPGDIAVGISTSGNSPNVLRAIETARARGLGTIALSGRDGGQLAHLVDVAIVVPAHETAFIQECHIAIGHILCSLGEAVVLGDDHTALGWDGTTRPTGKIWDPETLLRERARWRQQGKKVVWSSGAFDPFGLQQIRSLQAARAQGDILVVGIWQGDSPPQSSASDHPLLSAGERAELLAALECVDAVILLDAETAESVLARLQPDIQWQMP